MVSANVANVMLDSLFARQTLYTKSGTETNPVYSVAIPLSTQC